MEFSNIFDVVWCTVVITYVPLPLAMDCIQSPSPPLPREGDGCTATMKSFCVIQLFYVHLGTANATVIL